MGKDLKKLQVICKQNSAKQLKEWFGKFFLNQIIYNFWWFNCEIILFAIASIKIFNLGI